MIQGYLEFSRRLFEKHLGRYVVIGATTGRGTGLTSRHGDLAYLAWHIALTYSDNGDAAFDQLQMLRFVLFCGSFAALSRLNRSGPLKQRAHMESHGCRGQSHAPRIVSFHPLRSGRKSIGECALQLAWQSTLNRCCCWSFFGVVWVWSGGSKFRLLC